MQRLQLMSLVGSLGLLAFGAGSASAITLFDSHGFEPSADPTINYSSNTALVGQPALGLPQNSWTGVVSVGNSAVNNNYPLAGVFSYNLPSGGNTQYALLQAPNVTPGTYGYYYPQTNKAVADGGLGNYTPNAVTGQMVAITFSMDVYSGYAATAANSMFYGVSAFNGNGDEIASLGINNFTSGLVLPSGSTSFGGTNAFDTFYGYELLLNFATQKWSIYSEPLTGAGAFTYVLRATGNFANASTAFADADLAAFTLSTGNGSGYAAFDDYKVATLTPEPAALTVGAMALGLLVGRRRRTV